MAKRDPKLPVDPTYRNRKGLTGEAKIRTPTQVFAERVREVRAQLGWTRDDLAVRLKTIGYEKLSRPVLAKLEGAANPDSKAAKRERVSLEEVLAVALALGTSPAWLITPYDDRTYVQIATKYRPHSGANLRGWLAGQWPLADEDVDFFMRTMPPEDILALKAGMEPRGPLEWYRRQHLEPDEDEQEEE